MSVKTPRQLYKYLLRCIQQLPPEAQAYYKHHIRSGGFPNVVTDDKGYNSHADENDEERINQIINRAVEDAEWILTKYAEKKNK